MRYEVDPVVVGPTVQSFGGERFYLCGPYFTRKARRLHRVVWEAAHGPVPQGFHVHHRNHDRTDNRLANLELRSAADHAAHHSEFITPAQRWARSSNVLAAAAGNANLTAEQRAASARKGWANVTRVTVRCEICGAAVETPFPSRTRYCGLNCRATAGRRRRKNPL